jgi:cardiolipin synthase
LPAIPNILTIARLLLTPFIVLGILNHEYLQALLLLIPAGISDGLDGYLARRFHWTSTLGGFLDPAADKILLCGIYMALCLTGVLPMWLLYLVFGRDLMIVVGTGVAVLFTRLRSFRPSVWGKISTTLQIVTAVQALSGAAFSELSEPKLTVILVRLTAMATLWSGLHYYWRAFTMLSGKEPPPPPAMI